MGEMGSCLIGDLVRSMRDISRTPRPSQWSPRAVMVTILCAVGPVGAKGQDAPAGTRAVRKTLPFRLVFAQQPAEMPGETPGGTGLGEHRAPVAPLGSRIVLLDPRRADPTVTNLTPGFASAARPRVSFDARHLLFVGRREPDDPLRIWEMATGGGNARQITSGSAGHINDVDATYLSTMFTLDAAKPVRQIAFVRRSGPEQQAALFTVRLDGSHVRQITFRPHDVSNPYALSDGRLLFSSRRPASAGARGTWESVLFTVHADGTAPSVFAGAAESPATRSMPCETPDGEVVHVEASAGTPDRGGALVAVSRTRSLHTRRVIAGTEDGFFHSPAALPDGNLLVSYRATPAASFGIWVLDARNGIRTARVFDDPAWHEIDAMAIVRRPVPAGRSSVVDQRFVSGYLYCLDATLTDVASSSSEPQERIAQVRVIRAGDGAARGPMNDPVDPLEPKRLAPDEQVLGVAPVESDGSFHVEVPARVPLRLQTLDAHGNVLGNMRSWTWVMPGEARGCIGCHEDRELTPPNRRARALDRAATPVGIAEQWTIRAIRNR